MSPILKDAFGHILTVCIPFFLAVPGPATLHGQGWVALIEDGNGVVRRSVTIYGNRIEGGADGSFQRARKEQGGNRGVRRDES